MYSDTSIMGNQKHDYSLTGRGILQPACSHGDTRIRDRVPRRHGRTIRGAQRKLNRYTRDCWTLGSIRIPLVELEIGYRTK